MTFVAGRTIAVACVLSACATVTIWVGAPGLTTAQQPEVEVQVIEMANPYPKECLEPVSAPPGEGLIATSEKGAIEISTLDGEVIHRPSNPARLPIAWSPDGSFIGEGPEGHIYSVERDRYLDRLLHDGVESYHKKVRWGWSPIANCVLDVPARYPGALGLTVFSGDGVGWNERVLFKNGVSSFAYSPDGKQLAVYMHDGARFGIHIVDLVTNEVHEVVEFGATQCCFNFAGWTAGGKQVLYWAHPSGPVPGGGWKLEGVGMERKNQVFARTMVPDRDHLAPCGGWLFGIVGESMSSESPELRSVLKVLVPRNQPDEVYQLPNLDASTAPTCGPTSDLAVVGVKGKGSNARFRLFILDEEKEVSRRIPLDGLPKEVEWGPNAILFLVPSSERCHIWLVRDGGQPERLDTAVPCRSLEHSQSWDWSATPPDGLPVRRFLNNPRSYVVP